MLNSFREKTEGQFPLKNSQMLILDKVCKRFGGIIAANEVSFSLASGRVHGLIGPNGSGKSTVINLISGVTEMDSGNITLDGEPINRQSCHNRARKGISRTFQHPRLLKRCDIRTNLFLGIDLANKKEKSKLFGKTDNQALDELLAAAGLRVNLADPITSLSYGQQKLLEIVRAILAKPKVLLMDEPAAGLNHKEMEYIEALTDIALRNNCAVLLVEHAMDFVMNICDDITVLNFGKPIAEGTPEDVQNNQAVIEAYLGRGRSAQD